jgi:soluble lytic murein transglycosylase-like protein
MKYMKLLIVLAVLGGPAYAVEADGPINANLRMDGFGDAALCQAAIRATEQSGRLPAKLLSAIGLVESGRPDPRTGVVAPWPWTINIAGTGYFFPTKAAVIAAVQAAQLTGVQSIDVGCMQVNLLHHPHAFRSLEEAFDPLANATYAAAFLQQLHSQTNNWGSAAVGYHSFTPELGAEYSQRLAAVWPLAASYGLPMAGDFSKSAVRPAVIDPYRVLTPEFRARLVAAAASRQAYDLKMKPRTAINLPQPVRLLPTPVRFSSVKPAPTKQSSAGRPGRPAFF